MTSSTLAGVPEAWLFVLPPDPVQPSWFTRLDGAAEDARARVLWLGFHSLADAISAVTADPARLVGEQTRFLLAELVALYEADGLLSNDDTVVVAARVAWPEYRSTSAYVCQPERAFREGLTHLGFYAEGAIQPLVPRIRRYLPAAVHPGGGAAATRAGRDRGPGSD